MRVLTTWLRWGVLYRFPMGINSFHLPPFCGRFFKYFLVGFSSGTSRIAGFGEGTPQQDLPKGQNRRYADFGTVVESCSKKLLALRNCWTAVHFLLPLFQKIATNFFIKGYRIALTCYCHFFGKSITSFFIKGCGLAFFPYSLQHRKKQK